MNFLIQQFFVAKSDIDYSEIIFIVVIAVFWILGAIVKVVSKQSKKPVEFAEKQRIVKQPPHPIQFQTKQKAPVLVQRPAKVKKSYVERIPKKQPVRKIKPVLPKKPELSISMPSIETGLESITEREKKKDFQHIEAETLLNFESVDDLKKGILYYEILGKPLSLRQEDRLF